MSTRAFEDVDEIFDYIAYNLSSPRNAEAQVTRIYSEIFLLDEMPARYRRFDSEPWRSQGIHIMAVDNYCILYHLDSEKKIVTILRVVYGARDLTLILAESEEADFLH